MGSGGCQDVIKPHRVTCGPGVAWSESGAGPLTLALSRGERGQPPRGEATGRSLVRVRGRPPHPGPLPGGEGTAPPGAKPRAGPWSGPGAGFHGNDGLGRLCLGRVGGFGWPALGQSETLRLRQRCNKPWRAALEVPGHQVEKPERPWIPECAGMTEGGSLEFICFPV